MNRRLWHIVPALCLCAVPAQANYLTFFPQLTFISDPTNTFLSYMDPYGTTYLPGVQYTQGGSYVTGQFPYRLTFNWNWPLPTGTNVIADGCTAVCSYNYLSYGDYLDDPTSPVASVELDRATSFTATFNVTFTGNLPGYSALFDAYETTVPHGTNLQRAFELEVFLHVGADAQKFFGAKKQFTTLPDFTDANGITWHVVEKLAAAQHPPYPYVLFYRADGADMPKGTIHLLEMMKYAESYGYAEGYYYLNGLGLGAEPTFGQGSITYNSLVGVLK